MNPQTKQDSLFERLKELHQFIDENPYTNIRECALKLKVSEASIRWYLKLLERMGTVETRKMPVSLYDRHKISKIIAIQPFSEQRFEKMQLRKQRAEDLYHVELKKRQELIAQWGCLPILI